jgi:hypothetical protein
MTKEGSFLTDTRHPDYVQDEMYWEQWRETYEGGPDYVRKNLRKFSNRESRGDFLNRRFMTPIPSFAKSAVEDVRNAIFQRLRDVHRRGGSDNYMRAAMGEIGGVDNKGSSMQSFLGIEVLTELLVMGRVGVYVDMPRLAGMRTMADEGNARPYCYRYKVEDILSWAAAKPEEPGNFTAILLRDRGIDYNQGFANGVYLPSGGYTRYRFLWIDPVDRMVRMKLYDDNANQIDLDNNIIRDRQAVLDGNSDDFGVIRLELDRIPFHMLDIRGSILKDVYKHQVALLNLGSSDVAYALYANIPTYVEQRDLRAVGMHLKKTTVDDDGTTVTSDNSEPGSEGRSGTTYGRFYDLKADQPSFINPSAEPLKVSMMLQDRIEDSVRKLVNLAVQNKTGQRVMSAEALKLSDQGLEAGLSYIGLVLESAERAIAQHWASYESKDPSQRKVAIIKYPDRYSLKDDTDRIKEAKELAELMYTVPGKEVKKELAKNIVTVLLSGKTDPQVIDRIFKQIDEAGYATSDPDIIIRSVEAGLCGEETGSLAIGFDEEEYLKAREDHINRAKAIAEAQASVKQPEENMAARGVEDLDIDKNSGEAEREEVSNKDMNADRTDNTRGDGKSLKKGETNGSEV